MSDTDVLSSTVALHWSIILRKGQWVYLALEDVPVRKRPITAEEDVNRTAAAVLMLASYRNQSLHVFSRPAMLAIAIHVTKTTEKGEV